MNLVQILALIMGISGILAALILITCILFDGSKVVDVLLRLFFVVAYVFILSFLACLIVVIVQKGI